MNRRRAWVAIALILLLGAALRGCQLGHVPPGLSHDEVANGLIAQEILDGHHAIYFTAAYGHEPLYQYVQAATVGLFGGNWLGLRWPSLAFGLLGIAATYALTRRLFGVDVALLTSAGLSVGFWPVFYSRVGLRAISLPFSSALAAYFLFRAIDGRSKGPSGRPLWYVLGGLFLGLSLYTYMAARVLPFILGVFIVYRFLIARASSLPWSPMLVFFLVAAAVAAPLVGWLALHPDAEFRMSEVREPLDHLLAGNPSLVIRNLFHNLLFFTFKGDPWPHQGIPGRPVFAEPIGALLFGLGVVIAILRWRRPGYGFLLVWLLGALVPSILSSHAPPDLATDAPSSIRNILGVVVVFVFPALSLVEAGRWMKERMDARGIPFPSSTALIPAVLLLPTLLLTVRDYYYCWPDREDVPYFDQAALTAVGRHLDSLGAEPGVTGAGLSVDSMDLHTLDLTSQVSLRSVRLCDTRETLIIPGGEQEVTVLVPGVVPFGEGVGLRERLTAWAEVEARDAFVSYRLPDKAALETHIQRLKRAAELPDGAPLTLPASFSGHLALLGYEQLSTEDDRSVVLLTYWRVEEPPSTDLKTFMHLLRSGELVAQDDGLASPVMTWAKGDVIIQRHELALGTDEPAGLYTPQVGLYNEASRVRLLVGGQDAVLLPPITIP